MISAIVLAAGKSTRMGRPKLLLPIAGRSMIRTVVENALASKVGEVVVVVGNEAPRIRLEIESTQASVAASVTRLRIVENALFDGGQSTSLKLGLSSVDPRCAGAVILMGDQPFVGADVIDAIIEAFQAEGAPVVVPQYAQVRVTPVLLARELFSELIAVEGDKGGRDVVARHLHRASIVEVQCELAARDIDTWVDYQEYCDNAVTKE